MIEQYQKAHSSECKIRVREAPFTRSVSTFVWFLTRERGKPRRINAAGTRRIRELRETWGKFTDDELDVFHGSREQFVGKFQEKYGLKREEAEKELDERLRKWQRHLSRL
ncbi:MAG: CsbD family protein [Desulfomonilaceae bacterium]